MKKTQAVAGFRTNHRWVKRPLPVIIIVAVVLVVHITVYGPSEVAPEVDEELSLLLMSLFLWSFLLSCTSGVSTNQSISNNSSSSSSNKNQLSLNEQIFTRAPAAPQPPSAATLSGLSRPQASAPNLPLQMTIYHCQN